MIVLFDVFVLGLVLVAVLNIHTEYRKRRLRSPVTVSVEDFIPTAIPIEEPEPNEQWIIGLSVAVGLDGVRLEFYLPPNKRGVSSPITHLISTRQRDAHGILYEMATASGSRYRVSMDDGTAKQVLGTFYAWKSKHAEK